MTHHGFWFVILVLLPSIINNQNDDTATKLRFIQLTCTRIISKSYGEDWISLKINLPEIKNEVACPHNPSISSYHRIKPGDTWKFPNLVVPVKSLATIILTQYNVFKTNQASKANFIKGQSGYYDISINIQDLQTSQTSLSIQFKGISFSYNESYTPKGDYSLLVYFNDTMPCCSTYYDECGESALKWIQHMIIVLMILISLW